MQVDSNGRADGVLQNHSLALLLLDRAATSVKRVADVTPPSYRRELAPGRSLADAVVNRHGPNGLLVVRVGMVSTVGAVGCSGRALP